MAILRDKRCYDFVPFPDFSEENDFPWHWKKDVHRSLYTDSDHISDISSTLSIGQRTDEFWHTFHSREIFLIMWSLREYPTLKEV